MMFIAQTIGCANGDGIPIVQSSRRRDETAFGGLQSVLAGVPGELAMTGVTEKGIADVVLQRNQGDHASASPRNGATAQPAATTPNEEQPDVDHHRRTAHAACLNTHREPLGFVTASRWTVTSVHAPQEI